MNVESNYGTWLHAVVLLAVVCGEALGADHPAGGTLPSRFRQPEALCFSPDGSRLFVANGAGEQPRHHLPQSALYGCGIFERHGFKPSLPRALCVFSRAPRLLRAMVITVPRSPHGGAVAAGGVVHPVLA